MIKQREFSSVLLNLKIAAFSVHNTTIHTGWKVPRS